MCARPLPFRQFHDPHSSIRKSECQVSIIGSRKCDVAGVTWLNRRERKKRGGKNRAKIQKRHSAKNQINDSKLPPVRPKPISFLALVLGDIHRDARSFHPFLLLSSISVMFSRIFILQLLEISSRWLNYTFKFREIVLSQPRKFPIIIK